MGAYVSKVELDSAQSTYAKKNEIPSLTPYAQKSELTPYAKAEQLQSYYTKTELDNKFIPGVINNQTTPTCNADGTCTLPPGKESRIDFGQGNPKATTRIDGNNGTISYGRLDDGNSLNIIGVTKEAGKPRTVKVWDNLVATGTIAGTSFIGKADSSGTSDRLGFSDTRNVNSPPSFYQGKGTVSELKTGSILGIPGANDEWVSLTTRHVWADLSVPIFQIADYSKGTARRSSKSLGIWDDWTVQVAITRNERRNINSPPNFYMNKGSVMELKNSGDIGLEAGFSAILTTTSIWPDVSVPVIQKADYQNGSKFRRSLDLNTWSAWFSMT